VNQTASDIGAIASPIILMVIGMVVLLWDLGLDQGSKRRLMWVSLFSCAVAAVAAARLLVGGQTLAFGGGMVSDDFGNLFNIVLCVIAALSILMSDRYLEERDMNPGEYYALILFSTSGAMLMAMSFDLINVFLGLEILSVALYILSGFVRREPRSEESAVKYFLLGAFASGFLLYGTALVYGAVGIAARTHGLDPTTATSASFTNFGVISATLAAVPDLAITPLFVAGVALIIVGLGFKAAIVPFHAWTPDVYEGAPTSVTAFMSAAAKAGAFAAFIRVFQMLIPAGGVGEETIVSAQAPYEAILWGLAAATMIVGNVLAVRQSNMKRMLAYSSIAHAGYILVGVLASARSPLAQGAVLYYMFAYTFMNLGAFALVIWLGRGGREYTEIGDYAGLSRQQPLAAATMAVFMLSLAGIPPAAGFFGKLYLFWARCRPATSAWPAWDFSPA
jgi:NADH-quinone oxidoreductase subunit N